MSLLFTPGKIGNLEIKNRFVRAPIYEGLARKDGFISDEMIDSYTRHARSGIGLICTGYMYVDPIGKGQIYQAGIHSDTMIPGLSRLAARVHKEGAKIAFEISHAGRQTMKSISGYHPVGPSSFRRDPSYFIKPREMDEGQIKSTIHAFVSAADRAVKSGSDIVYIHAGGGDLLNQFLSPFFNIRKDQWGGSDENRFRIIKEIVVGVKQTVSADVPILVKMPADDMTPSAGITPGQAAVYAGWLNELGVNALELTTGVKFYNHMNCWRGEVPVKEIVSALPAWKKPIGWMKMKNLEGKHDLIEGWSIPYLKDIRKVSGDIALFAVGGMRRTQHMENVLQNGDADFISLGRPLIREPNFVKRVMEGKTTEASCKSCNRCIAGVMHQLPTKCYNSGLPEKK